MLSNLLFITGCSDQSPQKQPSITEIKTIEVSMPELPAGTTKLSEEYVTALIDQTAKERLPDYMRSHYRTDGDIFVPAPAIHAFVQEDNKLKVFITNYSALYQINPQTKTVMSLSGGIIPAAITYNKNDQGKYMVEQYQEPEFHGALLQKSIEAFCTMPVSGKKIEGLAGKIITGSNHESIHQLHKQRLIDILNRNGLTGYSFIHYEGDTPTPLN